jgi:hypothetical protein
MLGISDQDAGKGRQLADERLGTFVWLVLKDDQVVASVNLEVPIVNSGKLRDEHLEARCIGGKPRSGEQLLPVLTIDRAEKVSGPLDLRDQIAHRDVDPARCEVPANAVQRREHDELLMNQPGEPLAGRLRARKRRGQRSGGGPLATVAALSRLADHDTAALMLFDHVQLGLHHLVDDLEIVTAATCALLGCHRVPLGFEVFGDCLAARRSAGLGSRLVLIGQLRRRRSVLERLTGLFVHRRWRLGWFVRLILLRVSLLALRDRQKLADPFVPQGHERGQTTHLGNQLGVAGVRLGQLQP